MSKYVIQGGRELHGEVSVSGFKNAALAVITAAILVEGTCVIGNIPKISDVTAVSYTHLDVYKRQPMLFVVHHLILQHQDRILGIHQQFT